MNATPAAEDPAERRAPRLFYGVCAALWLLFAGIAWLTPIVLDDWFEVVWIKQHGLSFASVWDYASYNYFNYNPRLGETLLLVVNGPRWLHVLITPAFELGLLFVVFAFGHGRWPRATRGDAQRLLIAQALLVVSIPAMGLLYYYRPYVTNYLFGTCLQLSFFVPYRFELARATPGMRGLWWAPVLFAWGLVAGMTNEHTGPTAMVIAAGLTVALWRRGRRQAWTLTGTAGLWLGYLALFFAPGQAKRYGGVAAKASPLETVARRGFPGVYEIVSSFFWEVQLALLVVLVAAAIGIIGTRRRGAALAPPGREAVVVTLVALVAAAGMLATMLASPLIGERLYMAPTVLLVVALLPLTSTILTEPAGRRFLVTCAIVVVGYHGVRATVEYGWARLEFEKRVAVLAAAPPGSMPEVKPYRRRKTTNLFFGDDLRTFTHRQYVAHEFFGLSGIRMVQAGSWAEPAPPFEVDYQLHFEPPLAEAEWRKHADLPTYTPSYSEWIVAKLRRFLPALTSIPGHRLERVDVVVKGLELPELRGRRLVWLLWKDGTYTFPEGGMIMDEQLMPYFVIKRPNIPPGLNEAYVHACGQTVPVTLAPNARGLAMSWQPRCRGSQVAIACSPELCWLAAVSWR